MKPISDVLSTLLDYNPHKPHDRAVKWYAVEILENASARAAIVGRDPATVPELHAWMLDGAQAATTSTRRPYPVNDLAAHWMEYSYSGKALTDECTIARRVCGMFAQIWMEDGTLRKPGLHGDWYTVQGRALYRAALLVESLIAEKPIGR